MTSLKQRILLLLGTFFFFFLFYLRFLRPRAAGEISLTELGAFFHLIAIGMFIFSIIMVMRGAVPPSSKIGKTLLAIKARIDQRYNECFEILSHQINTKIKPISDFAWFLLVSWGNSKLIEEPYQLKIICCGVFLPPVILAVTFLFDVLILKEFWLFPKSIIILLMPMIIRVLAWLIQDQCRDNIAYIGSVVEYIQVGENRYETRIREEAWKTLPETCAYLQNEKALEATLDLYEKALFYLRYIELFESLLNSPVRKYYHIAACSIWVISYSVLIIKAIWL